MSSTNTIYDLMQKLYDISTYEKTNDVTSVVNTGSAQQIVKSNPSRVSLHIINNSANNVYVFYDDTVSVNKGYSLAPNGGAIIIQWFEDGHLSAKSWYAVSTLDGSNITVVELVIVGA